MLLPPNPSSLPPSATHGLTPWSMGRLMHCATVQKQSVELQLQMGRTCHMQQYMWIMHFLILCWKTYMVGICRGFTASKPKLIQKGTWTSQEDLNSRIIFHSCIDAYPNAQLNIEIVSWDQPCQSLWLELWLHMFNLSPLFGLLFVHGITPRLILCFQTHDKLIYVPDACGWRHFKFEMFIHIPLSLLSPLPCLFHPWQPSAWPHNGQTVDQG